MGKWFLLLGLIMTLTSCYRFGPQVVANERLSYNQVIQYNEKQQLLLNIVRLRYGDIPYFISLDSLVSQFQFERTASLDILLTQPLYYNQYEPNIGIRYNEAPTLTYVPLGGSEYIKRLLTPIDIRVLYSLMQSSWGTNQVFRMIVQRLGSIDNAVSAARSASSYFPRYKLFMQVGRVIQAIEQQNNLLLDYDIVEGEFAIKVGFKNYSSYPKEWKQQLSKIRITAKTPYIWLTTKKQKKYSHTLFIQTRTTLGLLNYLSKGVELPVDHVRQELAPITKLPNGQIFNWTIITHNLINIKHSQQRPVNYFAAVEYKGYWFYIDQSDTHSKETFSLLNILMAANHEYSYKKAPIFTIR